MTECIGTSDVMQLICMLLMSGVLLLRLAKGVALVRRGGDLPLITCLLVYGAFGVLWPSRSYSPVENTLSWMALIAGGAGLTGMAVMGLMLILAQFSGVEGRFWTMIGDDKED